MLDLENRADVVTLHIHRMMAWLTCFIAGCSTLNRVLYPKQGVVPKPSRVCTLTKQGFVPLPNRDLYPN